MPAFGEPRLDADLASIIAASEAAGKPGRAITSLYQKRVVIVAALLAITAIGLAEWLSHPASPETAVVASEPDTPVLLPDNPPMAQVEARPVTEVTGIAAAPRPARPVVKAAPRPSAKTVWYDRETAADDAFGKASKPGNAGRNVTRPKATTVFFSDAGSPESGEAKGPATLALGTE